MPASRLPTRPPPEVIAWAKRHFATDVLRSVPTFRAGEDPWLACERAVAATWRAARLYLSREALPDPPQPFELRRCGSCWTDLRMVPTEASGGTELMPLEADPAPLDGTVVIVPTANGPRARVYATAAEAQTSSTSVLASVDRRPRYRPHWADCTASEEHRRPPRKPTKKRAS